MDWKRAIEINRAALGPVVAGLVALLSAQAGVARLPRPVYRMIARLLLPAESAVRRLIVLMARGLVVPAGPARALPKGLVIAGTGERGAFPLFDARKHFSLDDPDAAAAEAGPRIRSVDALSPRALFLLQFEKAGALAAAQSAESLCSESETARLSRRVAVLDRAFHSLPRQAKRMARWLMRRALQPQPKFLSPLRPGPAPGQGLDSRAEIDAILRECHALARDALAEDALSSQRLAFNSS